MKNKTYTPSGFMFELGTTIDKMPNRYQVWESAFNGLDHEAVMTALINQITEAGYTYQTNYLARPRGAASHFANSEQWQKREIRFPVSKMVAFAERAGFNLSEVS